MVEAKPYRYGLIAAGMCVAAVGLFIMTQERPHVYVTLCALGVAMMAIGTVWSLCQCYPKAMLISHNQEDKLEDGSAGDNPNSPSEQLSGLQGNKAGDGLHLMGSTNHSPDVPMVFQSSHSCPMLQLI